MARIYHAFAFLGAFALLAACSPAVGSPEWCTDMKEKSKDQWTAEETSAFAKNCLF